jgi:hypothetical protein
MSDDADRADARIEEVLTDALAAARRAPVLPPTGECYYCQEPLNPVQRFCNKECAEDFELEQAQIKRMGRRGD